MNETLPIERTTLTEMVVAYTQAEVEIREAFRLVEQSLARLRVAFCDNEGYRFNIRDRVDYSDPDSVMVEMKHAAWRILVDKMGVRSAMSLKRAAELEEQLSGKSNCHGKVVPPLPEITEANILAMMDQTLNSIPAMIEEAVKEVYEWLRPARFSRGDEYVTNLKNEWALGERVILGYAVELKYSRGYQVNYHRQQNLTCLDNVFRMLDGKGPSPTHHGPLTDAIAAVDAKGVGETEYFAFKCFRNHNLHLRFKRPDLVAKLNAVAGGMRLGFDRSAA